MESTLAYRMICAGGIEPKSTKAIPQQGATKHADHLGFEKSSRHMESLLKGRKVEKSLLESGGPDRGDFDARFKLIINHVPEPEL